MQICIAEQEQEQQQQEEENTKMYKRAQLELALKNCLHFSRAGQISLQFDDFFFESLIFEV